MDEEDDAEALRRRLYRPGASPADLAGYLHAAAVVEAPPAAAPGPADPVAPPWRSRPWALPVAVLGLLGAVVLCGAVVRGAFAPAAATPSATVLAVPTPTPTAPGSADVAFVAVSVLDAGRERHAAGDAVPEGPDRYRYTLARGDTVAGVADRFGVCGSDVLIALPYGFDPGALPAGQTIVVQRASADQPTSGADGTC